MLAGTSAFQRHELDVAMELVDTALTKPEQQDYQPYVLEEGELLLAYACFGKNPMTRSAYDLYWLATSAQNMRQGHGRTILTFVEQEIKRQGGTLLVIETSSKETYQGSRQFYTRVGYELGGRLPGFYADNDDKLLFFKKL